MKRTYLVFAVLIFFSTSCDFRGENLEQEDLKSPPIEASYRTRLSL